MKMEQLNEQALESLAYAGYKYLISKVGDPVFNEEEDAQFVLYPVRKLHEALNYIGDAKEINRATASGNYMVYNIFTEYALEMASGVFGCRFYLQKRK